MELRLSFTVEVDAGVVDEFTYDPSSRTVDISIVQLPECPMAEAAVVLVDSSRRQHGLLPLGNKKAAETPGWPKSLPSRGKSDDQARGGGLIRRC